MQTAHASRPPQVHLASASPRRRELLAQIGVAFERLAVDVPERCGERETPLEFVRRVALEKARAGRAWQSGAGLPALPVLGADTAVVVDGRVLGKPADRADALAMLARLSGREHEVLTAVALLGRREDVRISCSRVRFRPTTAAERAAYWASGEPADKAGAYAIQGKGAVFIEALQGSYSGVMGLPLFETAALLEAEGVTIWSDDDGGA